jgi:hypothetical protein
VDLTDRFQLMAKLADKHRIDLPRDKSSASVQGFVDRLQAAASASDHALESQQKQFDAEWAAVRARCVVHSNLF